MGIGGCCINKDLKKSLYFPERDLKEDVTKIEEQTKIEEKTENPEKSHQNNFNKNGSLICCPQTYKQSELKLSNQSQQDDDEFNKMFNNLS